MMDRTEIMYKINYLPVLDGTNYTNYLGRIKVHLHGKGLWDVCMAGLTVSETNEEQLKYVKSNNEAIAITSLG
jgi:hypothetical protein